MVFAASIAAHGQSATPPPATPDGHPEASLGRTRATASNSVTLMRRAETRSDLPPANLQILASLAGDPAIVLPPPIRLIVPEGVPLRVQLKKGLPIKKVGQPIRTYVTQPVYAFDRVVVPAGSEVDGRISEIIPPSKLRRTASYLNADFSPFSTVHVNFDTLILKDGTRIPLDSKVLPDVGPVIHLETNPQGKNSAVHRAKGIIGQQWQIAKTEAKPSVVWRQAKHFLSSELPYHKQKFPAGTVFEVELKQPLDFGETTIPPSEMGAMGRLPAENRDAYARLETPLSSATTRQGAKVEAIVTRPVFSPQKKLLLPVGTRLVGVVNHVRPAGRFHRNGQLHFTLKSLKLPAGVPQPIEMALEGLEVSKASHIQIDAEGEASVASHTESRVLHTALSMGIAATTFDSDSGHPGATGRSENRPLGGLSGFKAVGMALSFAAASPMFSRVMGVWGACASVYSHFLARGHDLVLPKDTPIEVTFGEHRRAAGS